MELNLVNCFAAYYDTHCDILLPNGIVNSVWGLEPSLVFGDKITVGFKKFKPQEVMLLLRPISDMGDMTDEERKEYDECYNLSDFDENPIRCHAKATAYLISRHFDVFGLIDKGVALDKTKHYETAGK